MDAENALEEAQRIIRCKNEELLGQATRLLEMEHEIEALKHELETRKETGEDPQQLALDLEREKGRLAGQWTFLIQQLLPLNRLIFCARQPRTWLCTDNKRGDSWTQIVIIHYL